MICQTFYNICSKKTVFLGKGVQLFRQSKAKKEESTDRFNYG